MINEENKYENELKKYIEEKAKSKVTSEKEELEEIYNAAKEINDFFDR